MSSPDVIHSLHIPAFRMKQDVVPGRYTTMFLTPVLTGEFPIYCAEFCGTNHSKMRSTLVVHRSRREFDDWRAGRGDVSLPLPELGSKIFRTRSCVDCHSLDGKRLIGPTFKGIWGRRETLTNGSTVTVDENYVRESILNPRAKIVRGFPASMPPVVLDDREMRGIIEFLKGVR